MAGFAGIALVDGPVRQRGSARVSACDTKFPYPSVALFPDD